MSAHTPGPVILVFPRGQLSELDKAEMRDCGVLAIEADDPKAVAQLHLSPPLVCHGISGDALVSAAIYAISSSPSNDRSEAARTALRFIEHLNASIAKATGSAQ